jgi:hypothetical protein
MGFGHEGNGKSLLLVGRDDKRTHRTRIDAGAAARADGFPDHDHPIGIQFQCSERAHIEARRRIAMHAEHRRSDAISSAALFNGDKSDIGRYEVDIPARHGAGITTITFFEIDYHTEFRHYFSLTPKREDTQNVGERRTGHIPKDISLQPIVFE